MFHSASVVLTISIFKGKYVKNNGTLKSITYSSTIKASFACQKAIRRDFDFELFQGYNWEGIIIEGIIELFGKNCYNAGSWNVEFNSEPSSKTKQISLISFGVPKHFDHSIWISLVRKYPLYDYGLRKL